MAITLFTAAGCTRCKIVKKFMHERGLDYHEKDIKTAGKEDFQTFYRKYHKSIFRGPNGIEFPIYF
jgi:glutaredoxin